MRSGSLFTWGLGKAGQLGVDSLPSYGSAAGIAAKPTLVSFFEKEGGPRPVQVSWYYKLLISFNSFVISPTSKASRNRFLKVLL